MISFTYRAHIDLYIAVEALISIRSGLIDPHGALNNWDEDSVDPCSWAMITCSPDNLVTALSVSFFFFCASIIFVYFIFYLLMIDCLNFL